MPDSNAIAHHECTTRATPNPLKSRPALSNSGDLRQGGVNNSAPWHRDGDYTTLKLEGGYATAFRDLDGGWTWTAAGQAGRSKSLKGAQADAEAAVALSLAHADAALVDDSTGSAAFPDSSSVPTSPLPPPRRGGPLDPLCRRCGKPASAHRNERCPITALALLDAEADLWGSRTILAPASETAERYVSPPPEAATSGGTPAERHARRLLENDRALSADLRALRRAGNDDSAARAAAYERHDQADQDSLAELEADFEAAAAGRAA